MKVHRFIILIMCLVFGLTIMPMMVQAAYTVTVTEAQINAIYSGKVVSTTNYLVSNITADLQSGKVVINAKILPKAGGATMNGKLTLKPNVSGGKVTWSILSATLNGAPATGAQMTQLNNLMVTYWTAFMNLYYSGKTVNSVTITGTQISAVIN